MSEGTGPGKKRFPYTASFFSNNVLSKGVFFKSGKVYEIKGGSLCPIPIFALLVARVTLVNALMWAGVLILFQE